MARKQSTSHVYSVYDPTQPSTTPGAVQRFMGWIRASDVVEAARAARERFGAQVVAVP